MLRATSNFDELLAIVRARILGRLNILNDARKLNVVQLVGSTIATQTRVALEAAQRQTSTASTADLEQQLSMLPQVMHSTQLKISNDLNNLQQSLWSFLDTAIRRMSSELDHAVQVDTPFAAVQTRLALSLDTLNADLTRQTSTGIGQVFRDNINALGVNDETTAALELAMATATASAAAAVQLQANGSEHYETPMSADWVSHRVVRRDERNVTGQNSRRYQHRRRHHRHAVRRRRPGTDQHDRGSSDGRHEPAPGQANNPHRRQQELATRYAPGQLKSDFNQSITASIRQASYLATTALDEFSRTRATWLRQGIEVAKGSVQVDFAAAKATLAGAEALVREAGKFLEQAGVLPALAERS